MPIGVGLAFFAAFLFALGNILEKRAVNEMHLFALIDIRKMISQILKSACWVIGALASVLGSVVQVFAYHFVSISIVQSVGVAGVVLVVVVGRLYFHEHLRALERLGLGVCVVAFLLTIISIYGGGTQPGGGASYRLAIFTIGATCLGAGLLMSFRSLRTRNGDVVFGITSGLFYGIVGLSSKGLSTILKNHSTANVVYALFINPYLYVMLASWFLALLIFQKGLQSGRVCVIGPLSGAVTAIYVTAFGTPLFGENFPKGSIALILRILGFVGILLGSGVLAVGGSQESVESGISGLGTS